MLPALLMLAKPPASAARSASQRWRRSTPSSPRTAAPSSSPARWRGLPGSPASRSLRFDFNPLDLRSPKVESVSTLFDLMKDPQTSPNTIDVLAPSLGQADALGIRLSKLPAVGLALTLKSFVPDDQQAKLALISDASLLLDATLNPFEVKPPPGDAQTVASLASTAAGLRQAADKDTSAAAGHARALAATLDRLAAAGPDARARATEAIIPDLDTMLDSLRFALQAGPVTLQSMPPDMVRDWVAQDGTARIQVFPKDTSGSDAAMKAFGDAVLAAAPGATGAPISIRQSGVTIVGAFVQAGLWAFVAITLLLAVWCCAACATWR